MPAKIDLTGNRFGRLVVIGESPKRDSSGNIYWITVCDCGTIKTISGKLIRKGDVVSCGCYHNEIVSKHKDILNQRFGKLKVIALDHIDENQGAFWECKCDCGTTRIIRANSLSAGATKSCGCLNTEDGIRAENLSGKVFGQYKAIKRIKTKKLNRKNNTIYNESIWECECLKCGNVVKKTARALKHSPSETCIGHLKSDSKYYRKIKQSIRNRRVRIATPKWANLIEIENIYRARKDGEHVDHVIPLNGKNVCGLHVENNLRIIKAKDNLVKKNTFIDS